MEGHGEPGAEGWQDLAEVLNTRCGILSFSIQKGQGRLPQRKLQVGEGGNPADVRSIWILMHLNAGLVAAYQT